jgi:hypothetical protein
MKSPMFERMLLSGIVVAFCLARPAHLSAAPANLGPATAADISSDPALTKVEVPIPPSVFIIPTTPGNGRNPFFPNSRRYDPKPNANPIDANAIVLNGITSPPKPTAMINGRTFEEGETGDIKLRNGSRLAIVCVEIGLNSAVVEVNGQKRELHLRAGI